MIGRFEYKRLAKYPHMKPEDIAVWERFIDANPAQFERCDYDVLCGTGAPTNPDHPPEMQRDHTILTQKKIDVVAYAGDSTYVIEVGPVADARKLGQILTYKSLYMLDHPEARDVFAMVICREVEREMQQMFDQQGIIVRTA